MSENMEYNPSMGTCPQSEGTTATAAAVATVAMVATVELQSGTTVEASPSTHFPLASK